MNSHANRGKPLEQLVIWANSAYCIQGKAVINKVPTEWIPIRDKTGRVVKAKVDHKASVDFLGNWQGRAIAFDAKETHTKTMRWDRIKEHQFNFLTDWKVTGGISFVLVGYNLDIFFVIPWQWWSDNYINWKNGGPASFKISLLDPRWEIKKGLGRLLVDYLKTIEMLEG